MEDYEFKDVQQKLTLIARFLKDLDIEGFVEKIDEATAIGPLIDPGKCDSKWMDSADEWEKLGRGARDFKKVIEELNF